MAKVCGLFVRRLNEECVQKPVTERTHSEGTSQHKGHHKRQIAAGVSLSLFSFLSIRHCSLSLIAMQSWLQTGHVLFWFFPSYNRNSLSVWLLCVWHISFSRITWVCGVSFWNVTVYLQGLNFLSMQKRYQKNLNIFTIQADHNCKSEMREQRVCKSSCSPQIFFNLSAQHAKTLHF